VKSVKSEIGVDPSNIFIVAEQFWRATRILRREEDRVPPVVCAALALELYLKSLIAMRPGAKVPSDHNLKRLFDCLDSSTQAQIRAYFQPYETETGLLLDHAYRAAGKTRPAGDLFGFVLRASRGAFLTYRYIYEKGLEANQGWGADRIMQAARNVIIDRHPEWVGARQIAP
jgi:hypothetical protein